jgi:nicotinamidase-related amidase
VLVSHAGNPAGRTQYGQGGGDWPPEQTELMPGLGAEPGDLRVIKRSWGAFASTDLDTGLRSLGVTQVVIVGVATSYGIESTARDAHDRGYHVTVAADAVTDPTPDGHKHSCCSACSPRWRRPASSARCWSRWSPPTSRTVSSSSGRARGTSTC